MNDTAASVSGTTERDPKRGRKIVLIIVLSLLLAEIILVRFHPDTVAKLLRRNPSYPETIHQAFKPDPLFAPFPESVPGDWISTHPEPGQTFDQFVSGNWNRHGENGKDKLHIIPMGALRAGWKATLEPVREFVEAFFNMPLVIDRPLTDPERIFTSRINVNTNFPQLLTTDILKFLMENLSSDSYCTIAVTMLDLYPDDSWNFVFGQASLVGRVGVFSLFRYDPSFYGVNSDNAEKIIFRRTLQVLFHEMVHMFGVYHCVHFNCLMNGSNSMEETDSQPLFLCPVCLRKLHHLAKFNPETRYEKLKNLYEKSGLTEEAQWLEKRIAVLKKKQGL
ncbi:MAG: hypothetical protein CVV64_10235 [Candidatus Wallbacteria bacterium HGW-Wallbacteria-1]|jgi:archaemetzincin|uniref:Archaemetzincin n=1 Tax=Candidatus Wallbacteria bacterium HGW-Wallbacteria-1 TaxID=2013854 RepID=A0A2N1PPS8_9BACT|nr:MAG: hypothetical protein CVV64_10235 [Candidatus Wallbacteria bacterium HGW-Wallbacteria-1]